MTLRELIADQEYPKAFKQVKVGPLHARNNNVTRNSIDFYGVKDDGKTDFDASIEVFYENMSDKNKWVNLVVDGFGEQQRVFYVEGKYMFYANSSASSSIKTYIDATKIIEQ
jgi:hypothetical protein